MHNFKMLCLYKLEQNKPFDTLFNSSCIEQYTTLALATYVAGIALYY